MANRMKCKPLVMCHLNWGVLFGWCVHHERLTACSGYLKCPLSRECVFTVLCCCKNDDPNKKKCNFNFRKLSESHSVWLMHFSCSLRSIHKTMLTLSLEMNYVQTVGTLFLCRRSILFWARRFLRIGYAIYTFRNATEFRMACLHILTARCGCGKNRVYQNGNEQTNERANWERVGIGHARYRKLNWATSCVYTVQPRKMSIASLSQ